MKKGLTLFLVIVGIGTTLLGLSYHWIPSRNIRFPKDHLTFSNTLIFEDDIENLINRYNNASLFEQTVIKQEPLFRKLLEEGIIKTDEERVGERVAHWLYLLGLQPMRK